MMAYGDKASDGSKMLRQIAYYGRQISKMKLNLNRSDFRKIGSHNHFEFDIQMEPLDVITNKW